METSKTTEERVQFPWLAIGSGVVGALVGAALVGFARWQGYILGIPALLMGNTVSALFTGRLVYKGSQYKPLQVAKRAEQPGTYWFGIAIMIFMAWWLLSEFLEFMKANAL